MTTLWALPVQLALNPPHCSFIYNFFVHSGFLDIVKLRFFSLSSFCRPPLAISDCLSSTILISPGKYLQQIWSNNIHRISKGAFKVKGRSVCTAPPLVNSHVPLAVWKLFRAWQLKSEEKGFSFYFCAVIELQTARQKFLLMVVEVRKAKLSVKVFLMRVCCTCVTLVTAGHTISPFPVLGFFFEFFSFTIWTDKKGNPIF